MPPTANKKLIAWVDEIDALTEPRLRPSLC